MLSFWTEWNRFVPQIMVDKNLYTPLICTFAYRELSKVFQALFKQFITGSADHPLCRTQNCPRWLILVLRYSGFALLRALGSSQWNFPTYRSPSPRPSSTQSIAGWHWWCSSRMHFIWGINMTRSNLVGISHKCSSFFTEHARVGLA